MIAASAAGAAVSERGDPDELIALMRAAIARCALDLCGAGVLTEAASGAYVVTPVLAAMAGAGPVLALARPSRYGSVDEVARVTMDLARRAGVAQRVTVIADQSAERVGQADIITNSGHVRPIDAAMIGAMRPSAVIPLMYEAWELRSVDVDVAACRRRAIAVAGTNERHPAVDVFAFLGRMAAQLLADAGIDVRGSRILVGCDNPFAAPLVEQLGRAGALVACVDRFDDTIERIPIDVVLVAMQPRTAAAVADREAGILARCCPGALVAQFWGDLDRTALARAGLPFWPAVAPRPGHQAILPSSVGPEPVVRLQSGGLKVGQVMAAARRGRPGIASHDEAIAAAIASGFGQALPTPPSPDDAVR